MTTPDITDEERVPPVDMEKAMLELWKADVMEGATLRSFLAWSMDMRALFEGPPLLRSPMENKHGDAECPVCGGQVTQTQYVAFVNNPHVSGLVLTFRAEWWSSEHVAAQTLRCDGCHWATNEELLPEWSFES